MRISLLVLLNLPFALIGGVLALFISGLYLSVPASVGFIALFGIAVLNGIVLLSYITQLQEEGMPVGEAIVQGCLNRLRPVLMTATITVLSLAPLLFAQRAGFGDPAAAGRGRRRRPDLLDPADAAPAARALQRFRRKEKNPPGRVALPGFPDRGMDSIARANCAIPARDLHRFYRW